MSNGNYVKWEMLNGNVKWECEMGISNGKIVKWEKCQMVRIHFSVMGKWQMF